MRLIHFFTRPLAPHTPFLVVNGAIFFVSIAHPAALPPGQASVIVDVIYPVNITQSCLTTGLITFKIGRQYFASRAAGLSARGSNVGLLMIMRVIVESMMIFTIQQIVMCILWYLDNPAHYIFFWTLIPSVGKYAMNIQTICTDTSSKYTGVAFALLTIRVHNARNGPNSSLRTPQLAHRFRTQSLPCAVFPAMSHQEFSYHNGGRNHRRTVSDGALSSPFSVSTVDNDYRTGVSLSSRAGDRFDLEKGDAGTNQPPPDAVLAMKRSPKLLS